MEIIVRIVIAVLLMAVASVVGIISALVFYFVRRRTNRPSGRMCLAVGLYLPAVTLFLLGCAILSSFLFNILGTPDLAFGDTREALPNGYTLQASGKFPEFGLIQKANDSAIQIGWVESVQVEGPYVLGKYDIHSPRAVREDKWNFFSFDTRTRELIKFASESELAGSTKANIRLTPTPDFRGPQSPLQLISKVLLLLFATIPPLAAGVLLVRRIRIS